MFVNQSWGRGIHGIFAKNTTKINDVNLWDIGDRLLPIGSMYAIYGNIYHQYTPNVSIYSIPYMDPMGYINNKHGDVQPIYP